MDAEVDEQANGQAGGGETDQYSDGTGGAEHGAFFLIKRACVTRRRWIMSQENDRSRGQEVDIRRDGLKKCPNGWMDGETDRQMNQQMNGWKHQTDLDQEQEGEPDQITVSRWVKWSGDGRTERWKTSSTAFWLTRSNQRIIVITLQLPGCVAAPLSSSLPRPSTPALVR